MRRCNNLLNRIFITRRRMTGYSTNAKFRQRTVSPLPSHYNKNKHSFNYQFSSFNYAFSMEKFTME